MENLKDLFIHDLRDVYHAENQLIKALPKLVKAAAAADLCAAFQDHLEQTEKHAERLERIFHHLDVNARGEKCKGMEGLLEEASQLLDDDMEGAVRDAGLISAAQRVEHYEIAAYGTLCAWARKLGRDDDAAILEQTLEEESAADERLTEIAEGSVNARADARPDA